VTSSGQHDLNHASIREEPELHILFNNACVPPPPLLKLSRTYLLYSGIMGVPTDQATVDGYDMCWGTNTLGKKISTADEMTRIFSTFYNQVLSTSQSCFCPRFSRPPLPETSLGWSISAPLPICMACHYLVPALTLQPSRTLRAGASITRANCMARVNWYAL